MPEFTLHGYFRSSCTARLRIALLLKAIDFDYIPINLLKSEQLSPEYKALNPSSTVPLLIHNNGTTTTKIGQSVAALEYLDALYPDQHPLLPSNHADKATVRTLVNIMACDTQPVTNLRIMRRVRALGGVAEDWNRELMADGFAAYEAIVAVCAGKYSFGDQVTLADLCLIPAFWNAQRFEVDLAKYPTISRIMAALEELPEVSGSSYFKQQDTPEELRVSV